MSSPLTSKSIMLVDDEEELTTLYQQFLKEIGYEIDSFTDPLTAFENFKQSSQKYSMVLTDLRMPSMSGIELAQKIREIDDNVIINLITAFDVEDNMQNSDEYQSARIDRIFQKPIRLADLKKEIENCIEGTRR